MNKETKLVQALEDIRDVLKQILIELVNQRKGTYIPQGEPSRPAPYTPPWYQPYGPPAKWADQPSIPTYPDPDFTDLRPYCGGVGWAGPCYIYNADFNSTTKEVKITKDEPTF